jgi:O-antigen/teichoic acid export membrane protein
MSDELSSAQSEAPSSYSQLEGKVMRNTGWVALSLGASQLASLLSMLVLVRLLEPSAFGLVALAWSVLYFVGQIQESGVGAAIVYRRGDVEEAASSALLFTWAAGLVLYGASFAAAPLAASLLHASDLTDVLRVMALLLVFRGLGVVPGAILERDLDFRSKTVAQLAGTGTQVVLFIGLAFAGLGVWSLVAGNVAAAAVQTSVSWLRVTWRPSLRLASRRVLRELIRYGRFVGAGNVFAVISNTIDNIAIARLLGTTSVGFYSVAFRIADFPGGVIGYVVGRTMFPVYSRLQDDLPGLREAYLRNVERIALLALPASVGIAIAAEPVVLGLLGEKWRPAVTPLRILAIYGLLKPFGGVTAEALKGIGKPHVPLIVGVLYALVVAPTLFVLTPRYGLKGAALSMLIAVAVALPAQIVPFMRAVGLSLGALARSIGPPLLATAVLGGTLGVLVAQSSSMSPAAWLALLVSAGACVYAAATALFARSVLVPIWLSLRRAREH